jgi:hypothetical protein
MQNKQFFDSAEINKEVNDRLNAILTQDFVDNEVFLKLLKYLHLYFFLYAELATG